ncbi:MAG: glycosyltransferase family 2 protein [Thermoanaerobaculales bacterium]|jgi:dolichol-phosphate mannosyltransferase|nr:glycosyltransferase family 2 protein [Thermoanaerobaculales bacterium]
MTDSPVLSVVIPAMNEEENVQAMHDRLVAALEPAAVSFEMIWIDDGSSDATWQLISQLAARDERVRGLSFSRNFGHQAAVTAGVDAARGDAVAIIDADLQDPPEVIPEMIEKWREGYQVVYGQREQRDGETVFKRATSAAFYRTLKALAHIEIPLDTGDFRLMGPKALAAFRAMPEHNRFVRGMVSWIGFPQAPVRFHRHARTRGETKYPLKTMLKLAISGFTSFSFVPLRAATWLGLIVCLFSVGYPILRLVLSLAGVVGFGSAGLVSAIFFLGGVQLLAIGALGEYIARLFEEAVQRPLYLVKEHTDGGKRVTPPER